VRSAEGFESITLTSADGSTSAEFVPEANQEVEDARAPGAVRVACCQIAPDVEHPDYNEALALAPIAAAVDAGAQIVVVPELVNSGYVFTSVDEARARATAIDGELLAGWAREAARGDAVVVGGFCERAPDGRLHNSSALVDGDGVRAVYRKLHLWGEESRWFAAGDRPAPVVQTPHGRIGLGVCYDIEFPELTRGLALAGADLIALPANWPREAPPSGAGDHLAPTNQLPLGDRPILRSLAATTAYLSKVYVAVCDRCGSERGLEFEGGSVIAGPDGWLRAGPVADRGVDTLIAECDLAAARQKRSGEHNDAFADRRPEYYAPGLTAPYRG
jgi:predicted amidohydrolase